MNIADSCSIPALCPANASRPPSTTSAPMPAAAADKARWCETASHRTIAIAPAMVRALARSAAAMVLICRDETRRISAIRSS